MESRGLALLTALTLCIASAAQAQDYVRADCRGMLGAAFQRFETPEHARWYKRFWTGECDHLPMCMSGSPNWNDIVGKLVVRGGPAEHAVLLPKVCRLGQTIGMEWARHKKVRRIDTGDLRAFKAQLEVAGDPLRGVEQVETLARAKLTR